MAQTCRPLYPKVAKDPLKVAHKYRPLAIRLEQCATAPPKELPGEEASDDEPAAQSADTEPKQGLWGPYVGGGGWGSCPCCVLLNLASDFDACLDLLGPSIVLLVSTPLGRAATNSQSRRLKLTLLQPQKGEGAALILLPRFAFSEIQAVHQTLKEVANMILRYVLDATATLGICDHNFGNYTASIMTAKVELLRPPHGR